MALKAWENIESYMGRIGLLTDFLMCFFGILNIDPNNTLGLENNDEAEQKYLQTIESELLPYEDGDFFLESADENLQILFTLLKMSRDVIAQIDPDLIGVIQNLEQKHTILELLFQQYAFRNDKPKTKTRKYIAVMCKDWKVYKRYI